MILDTAALIGVCCGTYSRLVDSAPMQGITKTITISHPKLDAFETSDRARVWRNHWGQALFICLAFAHMFQALFDLCL